MDTPPAQQPTWPTKHILALCGLLVAALLSACETPTATAPPPPTTVEDYTALVSVTGEVVPATWATVSSQTGGQITAVLVEIGTEVEKGAPLVQLDDTDAQLALKQAQAALDTAQAQVAQVRAGARPEDLAVAEAQIAAAQAVVSQTVAQRDQLWSGVGDAEIAAAEAAVAAAQAEQLVARQHHDETMKCYDVPNSSDKSCPLLGTMEEQARAALHAADTALAAAEARVDALRADLRARQRLANTSITVAAAQVDVARAQLAALQAGPRTEDVAVAQAAVAQAQVALETAQVALARTTITAPFAGTVTAVAVRAGEFTAPGQPLVTLGDLTTLYVETTDLDEIDVARVVVGQTAVLTLDALPDRTFAARVTRIAPMAAPGTGSVNYTVVLEPDALDPRVRWGMTVFVDIDVNQ